MLYFMAPETILRILNPELPEQEHVNSLSLSAFVCIWENLVVKPMAPKSMGYSISVPLGRLGRVLWNFLLRSLLISKSVDCSVNYYSLKAYKETAGEGYYLDINSSPLLHPFFISWNNGFNIWIWEEEKLILLLWEVLT